MFKSYYKFFFSSLDFHREFWIIFKRKRDGREGRNGRKVQQGGKKSMGCGLLEDIKERNYGKLGKNKEKWGVYSVWDPVTDFTIYNRLPCESHLWGFISLTFRTTNTDGKGIGTYFIPSKCFLSTLEEKEEGLSRVLLSIGVRKVGNRRNAG